MENNEGELQPTISSMNRSIESIPLILKEQIHRLTFPADEVLADANDRSKRIKELHKATSIGNLLHDKVEILFEDQEGVKRVHTTIWAIAQRKVFLKDHRTIPISRIHSVAFY